ncbi:RNA-binding cell elongation regulator Jag/EloR [Alkalihalobacterium chitinilyticum]|uniref:RNA-binding protein KhpB n=1 Tax=Alkalihalobacterium chitinilyticum TaxID=2980103 RepID=A0ABT5VFB8_9BACI|nr:RNA-binding cell elongation regulator Jag/EloR [Alkalihalobacterium chitinilyticum]MDE5414160.1 protein jag [Alkalihalobacterium chitinilyticum]
MKKVTASGKTIEEAIEKALVELNTTREKVEVQVKEEPQKGFFGLFGGKPAVVEVELKPDSVEEARDFLNVLFEKMDVQVNIVIKADSRETIFDLQGEHIGTLIGRRGQTLDSLQYLVNLVANRNSDGFLRIRLDAENYRERRKQSLEQLAERLAKKAIQTKKTVKLEPMQAHERKIIHTALQNSKGIATYSEGQEPKRYIVINPK